MNNWTISGNVGSVEGLAYSQKGTAVLKFSVAVYQGKDQNGEKQTEWVKCVAFKELAERSAPRINKGDQVVVNGQAKLNQYTNKEGQHKANLEIMAFDIVSLSPKREQEHQAPNDAIVIPGEEEMF